MFVLFTFGRDVGAVGENVFEREACFRFGEVFGVFDNEVSAAQASPRLWSVTTFPEVGFLGIEDEC